MDQVKLRGVVLDAIANLEMLQARFTDLLAEIDGEAVLVPRQGRWTKSMVQHLWKEVRHLYGVSTLFGLCAADEGKSVTFTRLVQESRLTEKAQRNEHARMSRISAELFGEKKWPIENWQGPPSVGSGKAEMLYRMSGTIAKWWNEIRDEEDDF